MYAYLWIQVYVYVYGLWINLFKELIHDFFIEYKQKSIVWWIWKDLSKVLILVKSHTHWRVQNKNVGLGSFHSKKDNGSYTEFKIIDHVCLDTK